MNEIDTDELLQACSDGDLNRALALLDGGADINALSERLTPLIAAIQHEHAELAWRLLERGADARLRSERRESPLLATAWSGQCELAAALLQRGADPNLQDSAGASAVCRGAEYGGADFVALLLDHGGAADRCPHGWTPLLHAAYRGQLATIQMLLDRDGTGNPDATNEAGQSALYLAAQENHASVVSALVAAGADLNQTTNANCIRGAGHTALREAAGRGHIEVVRVLLENDARVDVPDARESRTALSCAAAEGHGSIVELLLGAGADPEWVDGHGRTVAKLASAEIRPLLPPADDSDRTVNHFDVAALAEQAARAIDAFQHDADGPLAAFVVDAGECRLEFAPGETALANDEGSAAESRRVSHLLAELETGFDFDAYDDEIYAAGPASEAELEGTGYYRAMRALFEELQRRGCFESFETTPDFGLEIRTHEY